MEKECENRCETYYTVQYMRSTWRGWKSDAETSDEKSDESENVLKIVVASSVNIIDVKLTVVAGKNIDIVPSNCIQNPDIEQRGGSDETKADDLGGIDTMLIEQHLKEESASGMKNKKNYDGEKDVNYFIERRNLYARKWKALRKRHDALENKTFLSYSQDFNLPFHFAILFAPNVFVRSLNRR